MRVLDVRGDSISKTVSKSRCSLIWDCYQRTEEVYISKIWSGHRAIQIALGSAAGSTLEVLRKHSDNAPCCSIGLKMKEIEYISSLIHFVPTMYRAIHPISQEQHLFIQPWREILEYQFTTYSLSQQDRETRNTLDCALAVQIGGKRAREEAGGQQGTERVGGKEKVGNCKEDANPIWNRR